MLRGFSVHGGCGWWRGWIAEACWGVVAFGWVRLRIFVFESAGKRFCWILVAFGGGDGLVRCWG